MDIRMLHWLDGVMFAAIRLINDAWRRFDDGSQNKQKLQEAMDLITDVQRDLQKQSKKHNH